MKKIIALSLALIMALSLVACGGDKGTDAPKEETKKEETKKEEVKKEDNSNANVEPVKIGLIAPMTGAAAANGQALQWMSNWIADYVNENGGIKNLDGAKLEIIVGDSQGNADIGVTEFERLVNSENVNALLGIYNSPVAMAIAPRAIAAKVPTVISNATTDAIYNTKNDYVFHANITANLFVNYSVEHMKFLQNAAGAKDLRFVYVYEAGNYGQSDYQSISAVADEMGIDEIIPISIDGNAADMASVVNQIKKVEDKILFVFCAMTENNATLFTRQMKEYNCNVPIVADGGGFVDGAFLANNPVDGEYILATANYTKALAENSFNPELAMSIMADFEKDLGFGWLESASLLWQNMWCLIDALERADSASRDDIAAALKTTDIKDADNHMAELMGASKNFKFEDFEVFGTPLYNCIKEAPNFLSQVIDGKYQTVSPAAFASADVVFPTPAWKDR